MVEISNFQKSVEIHSRHVGWSKSMFWGPGSGLEPIWTITDAFEVISYKLKKMMSKKSFWGDFAPKFLYGMVLSPGGIIKS